MKVSIVIPAYNEEKRIGETIQEYLRYFNELKKQKFLDFEIIVVINCSTDNTENIVNNYSKKYKEVKYLCLNEKGKGLAIIEGFKDALKRENHLIGFVDADMATGPESFYWLIQGIDGYDGTIASRALKDSYAKFSLKRKITHKGFNILVRSLLFLPFKDTQCGAKVFKKNAVSSVVNELGITQWGFDIDLLYRLRKKGFKIKEIKTMWEDKAGSKLNLKKVPIRMFGSIIRLRLLNSVFSGFVRLYDKMPESLKIHHKI